ncbi:ATP-binding cassette domain-containing protein [Streptomyces sviceus]|uniref:ATP-binding cassette domain-containing protein n=1 Tax=Streptomyces sviceus TaxID=285530 RepID=UPI00380852B9
MRGGLLIGPNGAGKTTLLRAVLGVRHTRQGCPTREKRASPAQPVQRSTRMTVPLNRWSFEQVRQAKRHRGP